MSKQQETLSTVRNAIRILREYSNRQTELGITELSERMELSKSSVNRIVKTLHEEKVLRQNPNTRKYQLDVSVFEIGSVVYNGMEVGRIASPLVERMKFKNLGDIHVVTYDRGDIIFLLKLPGKINTMVNTGGRISCHCTASGKILLAYQSPSEIERVLKNKLTDFTTKTITSPRKLLDELDKIKAVGYAESKEEFVQGLYSIAVPIYNDSDEVIAGISLTKNHAPFSKLQKDHIINELQMCSNSITEKLGVNSYNNFVHFD